MNLLLLLFACGLFIGLILGYIYANNANRLEGEYCNLTVISKKTGASYHALRYKIMPQTHDYLLYIYNYASNNYEWYPIWHFKNASALLYGIDPQYASQHILELAQAELNYKRQLAEEIKKRTKTT